MSAALPIALALLALAALAAQPAAIAFTDVTAAAGIKFKHESGAFGKKYLPETMGSGCAFADVDGDGWQDIILVQSGTWPGRPKSRSTLALYKNNGGNGTFTDITRTSGLAVEMYGLGVAAADIDNDGDEDLYVTGLGSSRLFRNDGGARFTDVTAKAGVADPNFATSALWFDYDRDGRVDLFVAHYVQWSVETDLFCTLDGKGKSYCTPESYKGQSPSLYRNRGDGTFEDVTRKAGLFDPANKMLGVALLDYDEDGWPDIFGANDTQPNRLYRNKGDGTFSDVGVMAGVAFNEAGVARAGMGVDAADYDGSGRASLIIGNFSNEMMALYANDGKGLFIDEAPASTIGRASLLRLTFACFFVDVDLDGRLDIFAANGHVADDIARVQPTITYAQPPHLFRNLGGKKFEDVSARVGAAFATAAVARGAAYGDYDGDGDPDLLVTANNGPARLLRNDSAASHRLRVRLLGTASNRDAIGSRVRVTLDQGAPLVRTVKTGSSYLSQSELPLTFGLGSATRVASIDVTWPNGKTERVPGTAGDQAITIQEGRGMIAHAPMKAPGR
ncbi:MAG TPA: CRTAC1 family protein [Vicinamibacterales bacterium]|nr:CRTAC1 family protein [Vicinamibacterales bacterium]